MKSPTMAQLQTQSEADKAKAAPPPPVTPITTAPPVVTPAPVTPPPKAAEPPKAAMPAAEPPKVEPPKAAAPAPVEPPKAATTKGAATQGGGQGRAERIARVLRRIPVQHAGMANWRGCAGSPRRPSRRCLPRVGANRRNSRTASFPAPTSRPIRCSVPPAAVSSIPATTRWPATSAARVSATSTPTKSIRLPKRRFISPMAAMPRPRRS